MKEKTINQPHWDRYIQDIKDAENRAASAMVDFAKSCRNIPDEIEVRIVEDCMELAGCNTPMGRNDRRWIEAQIILRDCITRTDRAEVRKIETALKEMAAR